MKDCQCQQRKDLALAPAACLALPCEHFRVSAVYADTDYNFFSYFVDIASYLAVSSVHTDVE